MKSTARAKAPVAAAFVLFSLLSNVSLAKAEGGSMAGGGGDLCEERFKSVAKDLEVWINAGGANGLQLKNPKGEILPAAYTSGMLAQLAKYRITCVSPGEPGYPVVVGGQAKECRSYRDNSAGMGWIICDRAKFYSGLRNPDNDPSQYTIVHHEFATLAGFEVPNQGDSQYWISSQITGFLESQSVQKLVVRGSSPNAARIGVITLPDAPRNTSFAVSPDLKYLAFSDDNAKRVRIIDLQTYAQTTLEYKQIDVFGPNIEYSRNGKSLLLKDRLLDTDFTTIAIYDSKSGKKTFAADKVYTAAFLADGQSILTVGEGATFTIQRVQDGRVLAKFKVPELLKYGPLNVGYTDNSLTEMKISPDGKAAVASIRHEKAPEGQQAAVYLIDLVNGKLKATFRGLGNFSVFYGFSNDGSKIIVQGARPSGPGIDRELQLIDVSSGKKAGSVNLGYGEDDFPMDLLALPGERILERLPMRDYNCVIDMKTGRTLIDEIPAFIHSWIMAVDKAGTFALGQAGRKSVVVSSLKTGDTHVLWKADDGVTFVDILASSVLSQDRALLITQEGRKEGGADIRIRILRIPPLS